jgi:SAM-dependent methyltransferase
VRRSKAGAGAVVKGIRQACGVAWRLARDRSTLTHEALFRVMPHPKLRKMLYRYVDWRDRRQIDKTGFAHLPPAPLRFRVHGELDLQSFLESGRQCRQDINAALATIGIEMASLRHILDFGCGCGRTIVWFSSIPDSTQVSGTDIDGVAIDWCRRYLEFATFEVNQPVPPLGYEANSFDLVYALSVFTHLNEEYQLLWLKELQRVTQPKGIVLLSLHGSYYWRNLAPADVEAIKRQGLLFLQAPAAMQGIFPKWYQNTYHTQEYVFSTYSKYFHIVEYIPQGLDGCQDIVLLQKREGNDS